MKVMLISSEWPNLQNQYAGLYIYWQAESLRRAGVEVDVFSFRGRKMPSRYLAAWFRLRQTYVISKYDLIHAHNGQSALLALPKHKPLVTTFHGSDLLGIKDAQGRITAQGYFLQLVSRFAAEISDKTIVVSQEMRQQLRRTDGQVLPCGINLELFTPIPKQTARKTLGLSTDKKLVFFAANPRTEVKRFQLASTAVQLAQKLLAEIELVVANNIPNEIMPQYMNACDVLLLTSMHEGSPQVVKEAMACNLPVVSVDVGDIRTRIGGQEGCRVCENDEPETIARHLVAVLQADRRTLGRESVMDLDEKIIARKLIDIYSQVIN